MSDLAQLGFAVNTSGLRTGETAMGQYARTGERTERRVNGSVDRMNSGFSTLSKTITVAATALGALGVGGLTNEIVKQADTWTLLNSQLRQVTKGEEDLIKVRTQLLALSRDTRAELTGTVDLFAEMTRGTSEMGLTSERLIGVTRTVNNLFLAGGKAASETAGAIRQLNQGFASGVLRGDEFNSVSEGAPKIMDALTRSLKITKGELREFAATGGITAEIMITALEAYSTEAQRLADMTKATFGQMATLSATNATEFIGQNEDITNIVDKAGESLLYMSESLNSLTQAIKAALTVYATYAVLMGGKMLASTLSVAVANEKARMQQVASTAATVAATEAEIALLTVQKASWANSIARIQSESIRTTMRTQMTTTTTALTAAELRLTAATSAYTAAAGTATLATRILGTAVKFMLGPWGLLLTAVGLAAAVFISTKSDSEDLKKELSLQEQVVKDLEKSYMKMSKQAASASAISAQKTMIELDVKRLAITEKMNKILMSGDIGSLSQLAPLKNQLKEVDEEAKKAGAQLKAIQNVVNNGLNAIKFIDPAKESAAAALKAAVAYKKWIAAVEGFQTPLQKVESEIAKFNKAIAGGDISANAGTASYIDTLIKKQEQLNKNSKDTDYQEWLKDITSFETPMQKAISEIDKFNAALASGDIDMDSSAIAYLTMISDKLAKLNEKAQDNSYKDWIESVAGETSIGKLKSLQEEIDKTNAALLVGDLDASVADEYIESLKAKMLNLKKTVDDIDVFGSVTDSINTSLGAMQTMSKEGSKEYKALGVAIQAVNVIQAVGAVLNQGNGDPYTAFGRMAAMGAAVASLGMSIGGMSSDFEDQSKEAQANQGLNVWGEKSTSIANAIDSTASATEKLVGINTSMLEALKSVQLGIAGAAGLIARDVTTPQVNQGGLGLMDFNKFHFDPMAMLGLDFLGDWIGKGIGKWLGGKSKVVDEGIKIIGGALGDLMDDVTVQAFQTVKYKKWRYGSSKSKTVTDDISAQVGSQFELIFSSIADSVFIGATTLGLAADDVEKAINDFNVATISISLKGLSADQQQKQLEAVFSKLFDNLASDVIDFLPDFQKVGEGLGETLARVATQVQITEIAVESFGFKFFDKMANPEMYTKAADNLTTLAGGLEEFAAKTSSFIDDFAPDNVKFNLYSKSLTESLDSVGLSLPSTSEGMFKLMQSLDGTTAEGQEQIAMLLNIQSTAGDYYNLLDEQNSKYKDLSNTIQGTIDSIYGATTESSKLSLDAALSAARMGDLSKALVTDFGSLTPNASDFSTLAEFQIEQAMTARKLEELKGITDGSVSIEDMTLTANQEQVALLTSIDTNLTAGGTGVNSAMGSDSEVVLELKLMRAELELIKNSNVSIAKKTASSDDSLNIIKRSGIEVRV